MLTQEEWYKKLKSWVPNWFFETEFYNVAVWQALAKALATLDETSETHFARTFILQATGEYLDAHGEERGVDRVFGEPDQLYAKRIQQIVNNSNRPDIQALVDALLITGKAIIIEHAFEGPYCNRGAYLNRRFIFTDRRYYNYFTVLIERQNPISNSFLNRETYANRKYYLGSDGLLPTDVLLSIINASINKARAAGVFYRIIEQ